jgi:uncharacterized membrane protein
MNAAHGSVAVKAPIGSVYRQWLKVEDFPKFITALKRVHRVDKDHFSIVIGYNGSKGQEGVLEILLRVPERRVAWRVIRAGSPCDHLAAGVVSFIPLSDQRTCVVLKVSSRLKGAGSRQVDRYLQNFKHLVEERTCETNGG